MLNTPPSSSKILELTFDDPCRVISRIDSSQGPAAFWVQVRWPPLKVFSFIFLNNRSSIQSFFGISGFSAIANDRTRKIFCSLAFSLASSRMLYSNAKKPLLHAWLLIADIQASVVRGLDKAVQRINCHWLDNYYQNLLIELSIPGSR